MNQLIRQSILVVDSNLSFYNELRSNVSEKIKIEYFHSPMDGLSICTQKKFDIVVSGEKHQEMSGINFLLTVKKITTNVVVILLLDMVNDHRELDALENGIDLVYSKDRSRSLLLHKVNQLTCETDLMNNATLVSKENALVVYLNSYEVIQNNELIPLTPKEYEILLVFLKNKNKVLPRQMIIAAIWDETVESIDERTIDVHIGRLRKKLKTQSIVAIRGIGYKWSERQL